MSGAGFSQRVVVIGGGFGGIAAVQALRRQPVSVDLIDRRNFHLFQPLLYQVATGGLSPGNIAAPLRSVLSSQKNCAVHLAEVTGFDLANRVVLLGDRSLLYDTLIVAAGARTGYFGRDDWAEYAPGLKSIEDALEIRRRFLTAFEQAEHLETAAQRAPLMTFVIVGGGPTGVELAGTMAEIARHTLKHDFRRINPAETRILLVDAADRILSGYDADLAQNAREKLEEKGVQVRTSCRIQDVTAAGVELITPAGAEFLPSKVVLWAAGVAASPLAKQLGDAAGVEIDRIGRIMVQPDLTISGHPEVFVIGDMAHFKLPDGKPAPGVAPAAMQQGKYVASVIAARLKGKAVLPFKYSDLGSMATIGRSAAIAQVAGWKFRGSIAWLMWLFIHLIQLVTFESRVLVLIQWAWNYLTFSRSARLITSDEYGDPHRPGLPQPALVPSIAADAPTTVISVAHVATHAMEV